MVLSNLSSLEKEWIDRAKSLNKTIVLPEAEIDNRVLEAGLYVAENDIANVVFLVKSDSLDKYKDAKNVRVVNYMTDELRPVLSNALYLKRKDKGLTPEDAEKLINNPNYFAIMMVELSLVDGYVCGAVNSTKDSLKPALQIIKGKSKDSLISSFFVMINSDKPFGHNGALVLADCGLNENPDDIALSKIAIDSANTAEKLCRFDKARVAMLSYSTFGSASSELTEKVIRATKYANESAPDLAIEGEMQLDAAIIPEVAKAKAPNSKVAGKANVLVYPDLNAGNIAYKTMQRFGGYKAIGPLCQGFRKPVNDLSRGANVEEIIFVIIITAIQCGN